MMPSDMKNWNPEISWMLQRVSSAKTTRSHQAKLTNSREPNVQSLAVSKANFEAEPRYIDSCDTYESVIDGV